MRYLLGLILVFVTVLCIVAVTTFGIFGFIAMSFDVREWGAPARLVYCVIVLGGGIPVSLYVTSCV